MESRSSAPLEPRGWFVRRGCPDEDPVARLRRLPCKVQGPLARKATALHDPGITIDIQGQDGASRAAPGFGDRTVWDIVLLLAFVTYLFAMMEGARCHRILALQISTALWLATFLHWPSITPSPTA